MDKNVVQEPFAQKMDDAWCFGGSEWCAESAFKSGFRLLRTLDFRQTNFGERTTVYQSASFRSVHNENWKANGLRKSLK
jgi:hypothetical protein